MTITIDCRMIYASGIGVYLRGCLPCFIKSENNFLLIGDIKHLQSYFSNNVKIIDCSIKPFSIKELFFFSSNILKQINNADIYYTPYFNIPCGIKIPVYTTIHDMIFHDMPDLFSKVGLAARMWFFRRAYKISKCIFTVSNFSKSRIEHHLGASKQIIVTFSAVQTAFLEQINNVKNIQKENTIIYIGNIKKHKGLNCLLDAFKTAKGEGLPHRLIIIGSKDNFRTSDNTIIQKIKTFNDDSVVFTGFISDSKLMEYIASASLLVQPSLYEGFCLPPLEAMFLGTNALISDIPVLQEVYADYPVYFFKAGDTLSLKENIIKLLMNEKIKPLSLNEKLRSKFTFEKTAFTILNNMESV